ncbi:MAG: RuBisCO large subunit C-terminal-like domain-containing protein [Anaerolineae bacterium]|nr:RuBisCO large subunit C-terminal-like domain-containing protein [Anaerolineae bacterium]
MISESLPLSGQRFCVTYRIAGAEAEAKARAREICIEQTVEFPEPLIQSTAIREHIIGRVESLQPIGESLYDVVISYAVETAGFELTQLLNVIFGNTSLQPNVRVVDVTLPEAMLRMFHGPRFGQSGLRALLNVPKRPLLCTAIKPMGLSPRALADLTYTLALGGIDVIKDDHGLADQPFARFRERVERCAEAVARANQQTGYRCVYAPNVSSVGMQTLENAHFAKRAGAGALLIAPGLVSFGVMAQIAADDSIGLPILGHPAFLGGFVAHPSAGIEHGVLFGLFMRLGGADATIFPNYGGRFAFSREACLSIAHAARQPLGELKPIFPTPAGGMTLARVPEMRAVYGDDVILLIGGGLHSASPDLLANCRRFREMAES